MCLCGRAYTHLHVELFIISICVCVSVYMACMCLMCMTVYSPEESPVLDLFLFYNQHMSTWRREALFSTFLHSRG